MKKLLGLWYLVLAVLAGGQVTGDLRIDEKRADGKWTDEVVTPVASSFWAWNASKQVVPLAVSGFATATDLTNGLAGKQPVASVLTNTTASFTTAQETKLAGIATGATANSSDATLLARANHTGTQSYTTISGLGSLATQSGTFSGTSSGTNTGDQTSIVGITGSLGQFNTALTGDDFATLGGNNSLTGANTILAGSTLTVSGELIFNNSTILNMGGTSKAIWQQALDVEPGVDVQAWSSNLSVWSGIAPHASVQAALPNAPNASGGLLTWGGAASHTTVALSGQSLTGSQATNLLDLSTTWNTTGNPAMIYGRVTNTASGSTAKLMSLGTVAGGGLFEVDKTGSLTTAFGTFGSVSGDLLISNSANAVHLSPGGVTTATVYKAFGLTINNGLSLGFSSGGSAFSQDLVVGRDGADILGQRRGTNAQTFRLYNTYTSATSYERFGITWSSNVAQLKPEKGSGGGSSRTAEYHTTETGVKWTSGSGTPEGAVTAPVGSMFTRTDGGASTTLYVKESGSGNTGWVAK